MKKKTAILLCFMILLSGYSLLSGCSAADPVPGQKPSDTSAVSQTEAASPGQESAEKDSYHFIFVCPIIDNEYWQACIKGIQKADRELGTSTRVIGPQSAANFSAEIIGYMEDAVSSAPDGIMAYAGIEGMFPLIDQAGEQGIPFLAIDSDAPNTSRVAYVGTDSYNCGYRAGEVMVQLTGGKGAIGVLCSSLSAEKESNVLNAFYDAISDYDMEVVAIDETDADPDVAAEKTRTMLERHPEITAMFNTAGYNVTGAARVKKEQNLENLVLVGFDDVEENIGFVREGIINALFVQAPDQMGYQGVRLLKECVDNGGQLPYSSYDTGTTLVTQENVDTYKN